MFGIAVRSIIKDECSEINEHLGPELGACMFDSKSSRDPFHHI